MAGGGFTCFATTPAILVVFPNHSSHLDLLGAGVGDLSRLESRWPRPGSRELGGSWLVGASSHGGVGLIVSVVAQSEAAGPYTP